MREAIRVSGAQRISLSMVGAVLLLCACAAGPKNPPPAAASPPSAPALDPSYDWHSLLLAPMGSALKDIHFTLHEVLLFHDESQAVAVAVADDAECYAIEGTTPQFLQHATSEFLLCFRHDRLARIEASVQLPATRAAQDFVDACGLWLKNVSSASAPSPGLPPAPATPATAVDSCAGVQAAISYSARLEAGDPDSLLSIKLNAADAVLERH